MAVRIDTSEATSGGYCPHCSLLVDRVGAESWPAVPLRCPHCQLLIGAGRGLSAPSQDPGGRGTAAGVFSRQAKRDENDVAVPPGRVLDAICRAADELGQRPERLLMVDYQQLAAVDSELPPLRDVFAAFGSWKSARREAADAVEAGRTR